MPLRTKYPVQIEKLKPLSSLPLLTVGMLLSAARSVRVALMLAMILMRPWSASANLLLRHHRMTKSSLAAAQVLDQRRAALVGDVRHRRAESLRHVLAEHVIERAEAYAAEGQGLAFATLRASVTSSSAVFAGRSLRARITMGATPIICIEAEVLALELDGCVGQRRQDQFIGRALEQIVAIRRGSQHLLGERAADAAEVLNQHGLPELFGQRVVHEPRDHVRQAAQVRHHQHDGF